MTYSRFSKLVIASMSCAEKIAIKLAGATRRARRRGRALHAAFFAIKAAETLQIAKALGWMWNAPPPASSSSLFTEGYRALGQNHLSLTSGLPYRDGSGSD